MLLAMLPARLLVLNALPAIFEAWLNLSQRENASVFMMVRTRAITIKQRVPCQLKSPFFPPPRICTFYSSARGRGWVTRTDKRQPQEL